MKRRVIAAFAVACAVGAATLIGSTTAQAASSNSGLYGKSDPTYDGVFRQSMAIIGLAESVQDIPNKPVKWLLSQQCKDGSFQAYVAPGQKCSAPDPANYSGPDSNSTALAAIALRMAGETAAANKAISALIKHQRTDEHGGWGWIFGEAENTASTGLAVAALDSAPSTKVVRASLVKARSYFKAAVFNCSAPSNVRYGLPNTIGDASVDMFGLTQGMYGFALFSSRTGLQQKDPDPVNCSSDKARQVASFMQALAQQHGGVMPDYYFAEKDWNNTATAIIGLSRSGWAPSATNTMMKKLSKHLDSYLSTSAKVLDPGAIGTTMQAAVATGKNPTALGPQKTNLVELLQSTMRK